MGGKMTMKPTPHSKPRRAKGDGGLYRQAGSRFWYTKIYYTVGNATCQTTGCESETEAKKVLRERMGELDRGKTIAESSDVTIDDLLETYLRNCKRNGKKTYAHDELHWRLHLKPFFTGKLAGSLTNKILRDYRDARLEEDENEPVEGTTINREFSTLRVCLDSDERFEGRLKFPYLPENNTRLGFLENHEIKPFLAACRAEGEWFYSLVVIALEYAWRKSEVVNLRLETNVDFASGLINLRWTKSGKPRTVPMTKFGRQILEKCCAGKVAGDWVFTRPDGDHVADFRDAWDRATEVIKHPTLIFHDLRRTGACRMVEMGIPERSVMKIAGWTSVKMLHRYLEARTDKDKNEAVELMNLKRDLALAESNRELLAKQPKQTLEQTSVSDSIGYTDVDVQDSSA
jgi:integrase